MVVYVIVPPPMLSQEGFVVPNAADVPSFVKDTLYGGLTGLPLLVGSPAGTRC